jgi:predicted dehydrogenase
MKPLTRKEFLKSSLLTGGAVFLAGCSTTAPITSAESAGANAMGPRRSPNGDVRIAVVGINTKGNGLIHDFQKVAGCQIVALCDVDSQVLARRAAELDQDNIKVKTYSDYRRLLEDSTIDVVVIATPNHWHALMAIWACQAGKDVYVEKPISHNVWEGRKAVEAAQKYNRIVQAGTQSRSDEALEEVFAYIRAGNLGKIKWVRGLCYNRRASIGKTSGAQAIPSHIDYDLWSGPAPLVPPRRNSSNGTIHYDWHWFWNYGGGDIANQGAHQMDMCRWALGEQGLPSTVMSIGGRFGYEDDAETPNTQIAVFGYESAPLIFEVRGLPRKQGEQAMDAYRGIRVGLTVECEGGYFAGGAGGGFVYDNDGKRGKQFTSSGGGQHHANFIKAVRSRKPSDLRAPIEGGHVSSSLCHLANISYRLGQNTATDAVKLAVQAHEPTKDAVARLLDHLEANGVATQATPPVVGPSLKLAPGTERFVTSEKYDAGYWANTMLRREYRKPFVVPESV